MFEVGRLVARIQMEGADVFARDLGKVRSEFGKLDEDGRRAAREVGGALATVGGSIVALAGVAISRFAEFDKAFSAVRANVQASPAEFAALRQAAVDAGQATVYTAGEAAAAQNELAKAGVTAKEILGGGLTGALALAASGQVEVADAAELAATAMVQFRLSGEKVPHLADLLAAGANKAQGGVSDLGFALKQSGLVASQMGLSVEDTIGTLSAFASAGLIGSDAGTSFRTMLLSLANPSKKSADLMRELGINAYDTQGKFVGITSVAGQLQTAFEGKTQAERDSALATIFGSDAIRAANVLYNEGAAGIDEWREAVDDSGFAMRQASTLQDNLTGDIEKLGGAFDSLMIQAAEGANGPLRDLVQQLTTVVEWFGQLPPELQQAALLFGLAAGGAMLFAGAALFAVPKIVEFREAVGTLNKQVPSLGRNLRSVGAFLGGPWGVALTAATFLFSHFMAQQAEYAAVGDSLVETLDQATGAVTDLTRESIANELATRGVFESTHKWGMSNDEVVDAIVRGGPAYEQLRRNIAESRTGLEAWNAVSGEHSNAVLNLRTQVESAGGKFEAVASATDKAAASEAAAAASAEVLTAATEEVSEAQADWLEEMGKSDASFVDLTGNIDDLIEKNEELTGSHTLSVDAYLEDLRRQVEAQTNWEGNMILLAGRVSQATLDELARMGPEGAPLVAELVNASDAELQELEGLFGQRGAEGTQAFSEALLNAGPVIAAAAAQLGDGAAREIATKLANGTATVEQIIQEYKLTVEGTKPVVQVLTAEAMAKIAALKASLASVAGATSSAQAAEYARRMANGEKPYANGGVVDYYAGGGLRESHVAEIAAAGTWRVWAEPETGGEAYIPLAAAKRGRSSALLAEVADRFGYGLVPRETTRMAAGGILGDVAAAAGAPTIVNNWNGQIGANADEVVRKQEASQRRANMRATFGRVPVR